jgi:tetratricopeptide (TPR) repeat protein
MNAAITEMTHCPEPETLAAFVDGRLNTAERQEVMKHMAECAECRDNVLLSTEIVAMEAPVANVEAPAANVVQPWFGWKRIVPLAAAASIAVLIAIPSVRERAFNGDPMRPVVKAWQTAVERPTAARVSVEGPHKQAKRTMRGDSETETEDYATLQALAKATERAAKKESLENLHALGLAQMLAGERQEAVKTLEKAEAMAPNSSAALLNDLAAAYLGDAKYQEALEAADRAWMIEQIPVAAWNRALALERLGQDAAAKAAWETYLKMEPSPEWAKEVRDEHLSQLNDALQ